MTWLIKVVQKHPPMQGQRNGRAKLRDEDIIAIRSAHSKGESGSELARNYKVNPNAISRIVRKVSWIHV
jgi:Mor family transcriptional regulator